MAYNEKGQVIQDGSMFNTFMSQDPISAWKTFMDAGGPANLAMRDQIRDTKFGGDNNAFNNWINTSAYGAPGKAMQYAGTTDPAILARLGQVYGADFVKNLGAPKAAPTLEEALKLTQGSQGRIIGGPGFTPELIDQLNAARGYGGTSQPGVGAPVQKSTNVLGVDAQNPWIGASNPNVPTTTPTVPGTTPPPGSYAPPPGIAPTPNGSRSTATGLPNQRTVGMGGTTSNGIAGAQVNAGTQRTAGMGGTGPAVVQAGAAPTETRTGTTPTVPSVTRPTGAPLTVRPKQQTLRGVWQ